MKNTIELGDVFEIKTINGYAYMQCVDIPGNNDEVELVKVYYDIYTERPSEIEAIINNDFFYIRFPLKASYRRKIVEKAGYLPLPQNFEIPNYFRAENMFGEGWQIVNAKTWHRETVKQLSDDQKKLSPWGRYE